MTYISNTVLTISMFQQKTAVRRFQLSFIIDKNWSVFVFVFFFNALENSKTIFFFTKNTQRLFYFASLSLLMSVYQE